MSVSFEDDGWIAPFARLPVGVEDTVHARVSSRVSRLSDVDTHCGEPSEEPSLTFASFEDSPQASRLTQYDAQFKAEFRTIDSLYVGSQALRPSAEPRRISPHTFEICEFVEEEKTPNRECFPSLVRDRTADAFLFLRKLFSVCESALCPRFHFRERALCLFWSTPFERSFTPVCDLLRVYGMRYSKNPKALGKLELAIANKHDLIAVDEVLHESKAGA